MKAQILGNQVNLGLKSYIAWCSKAYEQGLIPRIETNEYIWSTDLNTDFIGSFISRWFDDIKRAEQFFNMLVSPAFSLLRDSITTPLFLGTLCLSVERTNTCPLHLTNKDASFVDRETWVFASIEEVIQYTPPDRLTLDYLQLDYQALRFYAEVARFWSGEIIPISELLLILADYITWSDDTDILNTIDEVGIILWHTDDCFGWGDDTIKQRLVNLKYKDELWSTIGRLVKNLH